MVVGKIRLIRGKIGVGLNLIFVLNPLAESQWVLFSAPLREYFLCEI